MMDGKNEVQEKADFSFFQKGVHRAYRTRALLYYCT